MSNTNSQAQFIGRRGELMAELFLQDIGASVVARPHADIGYDFVVGFPNASGGIDFGAIEVKSTEHPVADSFPLGVRWCKLLAHTNVPTLLLVADVKRNRMYYGEVWPKQLRKHRGSGTIQVQVMEVDDASKKRIRQHLSRTPDGTSS
jgi:hypothetical protein